MAPAQLAAPGDHDGHAGGHDPATARLLLALTSLYVQRPVHTMEEQQQYDELVLHLIDKAGPETRAAVAAMLRRHPDAPAGTMERLGGAPCVDDGCVDENCAGHDGKDGGPSYDDGPSHAAPDEYAAGDRPAESDPSPESGQCAAGREGEPAPAPSDAAPAAPQLEPLTPEAGEAFFAASPVERRRLLSLLAMRGAEAAPEGSRRFHVRIDPTAWRGRTDAFVRDFERLLDAPRSVCERILNDPSGEPMVVAAKATGMPVAMLQRILLLVSPATNHSVQRVHDLTELYHGLDNGAARDLLAAWRRHANAGGRPPQTALAVIANPRSPNLRARFAALNARIQKQAGSSQTAGSRESRQDQTSGAAKSAPAE